jgi:preprotein translocase subunit YajC
MLINQAFAQTLDTAAAVPAVTDAVITAAGVPDTTTALLWNAGFIAVMVFFFYFLLIRPQQVRYRLHDGMLKALKKGEKIILQSGLIATIHEIKPGEPEAVVDLSDSVRVRIMRSAIAGRYEDFTDEKK